MTLEALEQGALWKIKTDLCSGCALLGD